MVNPPQNVLPFYYVQFSQIGETTTSAVAAAPTVLATFDMPVTLGTSTTGRVLVAFDIFQGDLKESVGAETVTVVVQRSLDGGATWGTQDSISRTAATYATVLSSNTDQAYTCTASPFKLRLIFYTDVGVETASIKNVIAKMVVLVN